VAVRSYRDLTAWQRGMDLVVEVYKLTRCFPREEIYGLVNQLRRAAVSIPSNIAEGQGRGAGKEFVHFLRIARGSAQEVETQLVIAERLGFVTSDQTKTTLGLADEVCRLIMGLSRSLSESS